MHLRRTAGQNLFASGCLWGKIAQHRAPQHVWSHTPYMNPMEPKKPKVDRRANAGMHPRHACSKNASQNLPGGLQGRPFAHQGQNRRCIMTGTRGCRPPCFAENGNYHCGCATAEMLQMLLEDLGLLPQRHGVLPSCDTLGTPRKTFHKTVQTLRTPYPAAA